MTCHIVTEGHTDALLLTELLKPEFDTDHNGIHIIEAGGRSGADSFARSVLATRDEPVALVVDADTVDPEGVVERRSFLEHSLGQVALHDRWKVFLVVPCLEALLFKDKAVLEGIVATQVSPEDLIRGEYDPKTVLQNLLKGKPLNIILEQRLSQHDLSTIRDLPLIRELKAFLHEVSKMPV